MAHTKEILLPIAKKVQEELPLSHEEISSFLSFKRAEKENKVTSFLKKAALPASIIVSACFAIFPDYFEAFTKQLPSWTNLHPRLLAGLDYLWDILGEPTKKANIIYHIPNFILYAFGIKGIKTLIETVEHRTWLEKVLQAQAILRENIEKGFLNLNLKKGFSILFVGKGDFIGMQYTIDHAPDETLTISQVQPTYTNIWNRYDITTLYDDLKDVLLRCDPKDAGEYVFFPVKDDEIFLPNENAYDLSPHKLDIICQNLRTLEKEMGWNEKRIIIIGDKNHMSFVRSVDQKNVIRNSEDSISLESISKKYGNITLLDPTDIVMKKIVDMAKGRKILFRATEAGINEYKERFYERLKHMGYKESGDSKGTLTIGYDIFEDQTEQQKLSQIVDDYYPVVLSKNVCDALIRNGYKKNEFLYVPDLVIKELRKVAAEQ